MITDEMILDWLESGLMVVDLITCEMTFRDRSIKAFPIGSDHARPERTRYAFGIRFEGQRRTILRSKLVYMAGTLGRIPDGCVIHHLNEDRYDDKFANLIALSNEDHSKLHGQFFETKDNIPF